MTSNSNSDDQQNTGKQPTTIADRYHVMKKLGEGGMGVVYQAHDPKLDQIVSIKLLKTIGDMRESAIRFQREAKAASQLTHANLATVLDFGVTSDGSLYMVSKFIEGITLGTYIKRNGYLPLDKALSVIYQIADCMAYIHDKGILHRDLKSGNIIVSEADEAIEAYVLDFGIAKLVEEHVLQDNVTAAGTILGSPLYMSPEQGLGLDIDFRSDIYSLGCIAFEIISGSVPFRGDTIFDVIKMHSEEAIPTLESICDREDIPEELQATVFKMLEKEPEDRFQTMKEVAESFKQLIEIYAPKHNWKLRPSQADDEPVSLLHGFSTFSSRTPKIVKIVFALAAIILIGFGGFELMDSMQRLSIQKEVDKETAKHKVRVRNNLGDLKTSLGEVFKSEAKIIPYHSQPYRGYKTFHVYSADKSKMPDWKQLENQKAKIHLHIEVTDLEMSTLKDILKIKNLKILSLKFLDHGISNEFLREIVKRKDLEGLCLFDSKNLTAQDIESLSTLKNLFVMQLEDCDITFEKAKEIAKLNSLVYLELTEDDVLDNKSLSYILSKLNKLHTLSLRESKVKDDCFPAIARCKTLRALGLYKVKTITDRALFSLSKNKSKVIFIDLYATRITKAGFNNLRKLKYLQSVSLGSNPNLTQTEAVALAKTTKFRVMFYDEADSMKEMDKFFDF